MFLGLACLLLSTGSTRLILAWWCVQLFRIQAIEDGPDGPEFLPDLSRPIRNPAVEGEDVVAAGGEGEDDAPPTRGEESQEPVGPGKHSAPAGGAHG